MNDRRLLAAAAAILLAASNTSFASLIPGYPDNFRRAYDSREVALLPAYCKYTLSYRDNVPGGNDPAVINHMYAQYGVGFHALHHYCWAIMATNRALYLARTNELRVFYLKEAVADIDYVLANSQKDFVLLPELLTARAKNLMLLESGASAVADLLRAIEIKPDYWPPYAALSDYYKDSGDIEKARAILKQGLSLVPEAGALKKRLEALAGGGSTRTRGAPDVRPVR